MTNIPDYHNTIKEHHMTDDRFVILEKWIEKTRTCAMYTRHLEKMDANHTAYENFTKSLKTYSDSRAILEAHNPWLVPIIQIIGQA